MSLAVLLQVNTELTGLFVQPFLYYTSPQYAQWLIWLKWHTFTENTNLKYKLASSIHVSLSELLQKVHSSLIRIVLCVYAQSCPILCGLMDWSLPGPSVHEISQARILEWAAISSSRGSSQPRNRPAPPALAGRFLTTSTTCQVWAVSELPHVMPLGFISMQLFSFGKSDMLSCL